METNVANFADTNKIPMEPAANPSGIEPTSPKNTLAG